uniref:Outer dense fiber protein 2 n=1 Tax=Poecilia reticulata TaxID=8081 RepID=A0A3P9NGC3_POERE
MPALAQSAAARRVTWFQTAQSQGGQRSPLRSPSCVGAHRGVSFNPPGLSPCPPQRTVSEDRSPLRPCAKVKTRLPWVPPGKTSYKWEGPTHCLEIKPPEPEPDPELRLSDLTSEDEQRLRGRISQYEKKIEGLMSEVSSLKTEVGSGHFLCGEVTSCGPRVPSPDPFPKDPELLLQKLREAEADAAAAAKQVHALKEHVCKLGDSTPMWAGLDQQKELLLHKLEAFEVTNRALRHLLREQRESQVRRPDSELSLLVKKLQEKEKELHQLSTQLDSEKENARRSSDLSRNLDATRARLQGQLRSKEAENNRLVVQIKNLERTANQQLAEADQVAQQLGRAKQEAQEEQEALKRVSQAQKKRMELCEGTAGQLTAQLLQRVGPTWPHATTGLATTVSSRQLHFRS